MTQISKKFLQDNAVDGAKARLNNNQTLRARNAANTADVDILKVDTGNLLVFTTQPKADAALAIPTSDKDYVTVEYVKNYIQGKVDAKDAVNYLSAINVAGTFSAGNSTTPATLTGATQLVVDGKTFTGADVTTPRMRIALVGQTAGLQNGIYDLTAASASSFTLTRSPDFDGLENAAGGEITSGAYFNVISGTTYAGYEALLSTADPITVNTTSLNFVLYPTTLNLIGGDMITKSGNTFSVDLQTNGGLESSNPGNDAGQLRVKVDAAALEKDKTTAIKAADGSLIARKTVKQTFTLAAADITNQYIDLASVAGDQSVIFYVDGGPTQRETSDYTVNYTGGTGGKTRITFAGGLASGGVSALAAGDVVTIQSTQLTL